MSFAEVMQGQVAIDAPNMPREERKIYNAWRLRILFTVVFGYSAYYSLRQNYAYAIPELSAEFGYSKAQLGMVSSIFFVVYGVGKFVNGYFSDRSDARYFISIGLFLSAVVSFLMGFSENLWIFGGLWVLNGWFQSMGWPPVARLISHWYSPKELGTKWALCASSHQVGAMAIAILAPFLIITYGWSYAFFIPAVIATGSAFVLFERLRDTPKEVGLPTVEFYKGDSNKVDPLADERITVSEVLQQVIWNKLVWFVAIGNMCLYIPRLGILVWAPTFLKEVKGVSLMVAGGQAATFELAGLVGGLIAGWLSDRVFQGRRGPVSTLFMVLTAGALYLEWLIPAGYPWLDTLVLGAAGFFIYGPQVLAGVAATDFASKRAAGVASGFIGVMASLGSCISGAGVGLIVDNYGWEAGFMLFVITGLIGAFFFALTWHHRAKILD
jgi:phosphoglycerate transporter family protein